MEEYLDDLGTTITLGSYEDIIALAHIGIEPAEMALAHYFADPAAQAHDLTKAYYWYKQAAAKGSADNQYQLALCYWEGKGGNQDDVAAYHFFEKAAVQGMAEAQFAVGRCYALGRGVVQDANEAFKYASSI